MNILSYDSGEMRKGRIGKKCVRAVNDVSVGLTISQDGKAMHLSLATTPMQTTLERANASHVITQIKDGRIYIKPCNHDGYSVMYNKAKSGGVTKRCSIRVPITQEESEALKPFTGDYVLQRATSGTQDLFIDLRQRLPF